MQQGWFITQLTYGNFTINELRITNNANMLYQFKNQIPFGLACVSPVTKREPSLQDDFATNSATLYILTAAEVEQFSEYLSGQI